MGAQVGQCQIYLITEVDAGSSERIAAAAQGTRVASILLRTPPPTTSGTSNLKSLVEMVQKKGIAALIENDAQLARTVRADGVHLSAGPDLLERYADARSILGAGTIVGVDAGGSRHLAMEAGEAGADYVAFGNARVTLEPLDEDADPLPGHADASTAELIAWWSEIFEVPCVAMDAGNPDQIADVVAAGTDFLGVLIPPATTVADVPERMRAAADMIAATGKTS